MLNSLVIPMKWEQPSLVALVPGPDIAQSIIDRWIPFNQRDTSVANMHDLYPISHRIPVVALVEEYSIPFSSYLNKNSYLHVAEDGMHMCNHDFNEMAKLVCSNLFSHPLSFLFGREFLWHHFVLMPHFLQAIISIRTMAH